MDEELILIYEAGETCLIPKSEIYIPPFERDGAILAAIAADTEAQMLKGQNETT